MASTTTFGDFPGVRVTTAGGAITGIAVGREQNLVLIGEGDGGTAPVNEPTQINARLDADRKFGADSELALAMRDALANGANIDFLFGVQLDTESITGETFAGTDSGTLAEAPIVEDTNAITATDTTAGSGLSVELVYESPPAEAPTETDSVVLNPITGEFLADEASDYEFDYESPDHQSALSAAQSVFGDEESGIIALQSESEALATDLSGVVNELRGRYEMAIGLQAAEPNATGEDGEALVEASSYTDSIDNDAMFLHAPGRIEGSTRLLTGALGGLMAGNALNDSIYRENLTVDNLEQRISKADADDLRDEDVVPVRQPPQGGAITVSDNLSTSTEEDYVRDYFTRRIVDQVVLIAKSVGDAVIGRINDEQTRSTVENQLRSELRGLAGDRLIESNIGAEEPNWFVDVYEVDVNTVGIDVGVTPLGIVKRVDVSITINT